MKVYLIITCIFFAELSTSFSQISDVKTILSSFLRECYSDPRLLNRNNLPPMTIPVLLDIIRKIEDNVIGDMRQISTAIIYLFRQDGMVYDPTATGTHNIVPFKPTGYQAYKNRLLLNKLLSKNLLDIPNELLSPENKCALHHMLSNNVALHNRGDEEWTCPVATSSNNRMSEYRKELDIELFDINAPMDAFARQITGISNCPIETGVVFTPWGEVSMGTVITGIAAGLEEQKVLVTDLVTVRQGFNNGSIVINNRYATTIAGDIAEVAVRQGLSGTSINVGGFGGWNSTSARRYYFLNRNENLELTNAEIRGGLDGIILSELGNGFVNQFAEFKLSQLIDMYYTQNGILHQPKFRACNRKVLVPEVASTRTLMQESLGPAIALYHVSSLPGSTTLRGLEAFVNNTITAFNSYIPQNINDSLCFSNTDQVIRPKINLIVITEPTIARRGVISHLVEQIDVGKFGSSIMLLNSANGDIVVDKTFSVATFYEEFEKNILAQSGMLDMLKVTENLISIITEESEREGTQHYIGGNATVALFLSEYIQLEGREHVQTINRINWLKQNAPDLRLLYATSSTSQRNLASVLSNPEDFIPIMLNSISSSFQELLPVINTIIRTPRRVINPECRPRWVDVNSGIVSFDDFVDADGINAYRIVPNYFFVGRSTRLLRIHSTEYGPITVCHSRSNSFPRRNKTISQLPADVSCEFISNGEITEISLEGACEGFNTISDCPPLYFTIATTLIPAEPMCKDFGCRFPNDVKYSVTAHDLGCFNGSNLVHNNTLIINITIILIIIFNNKI